MLWRSFTTSKKAVIAEKSSMGVKDSKDTKAKQMSATVNNFSKMLLAFVQHAALVELHLDHCCSYLLNYALAKTIWTPPK
jgi:hypothetical protein